MNGIKPIQPNNIFRVQPVNLFENRKRQEPNTGLFQNNLNHPKIAGSETQARFLDIMA